MLNVKIVKLNAKGGFIAKNFIKSTAKDRCFLNGASHHPTSIHKSIVFEEAVRLRRLNERKSDYLKSLVNLKQGRPTRGPRKGFERPAQYFLKPSVLSILTKVENRFDVKTYFFVFFFKF